MPPAASPRPPGRLVPMSILTKVRRAGLTGEALDDALNDLLLEAFAVTREAARREIGQRHFDVQLMGGAALHFGWIAEMKTGEGKTLVSTLPAYLNGLTGRGMHIITVNDYLAKRDAEWMGRIHRWLGLSVGLVIPGMHDPSLKRQSYGCDITYGTDYEVDEEKRTVVPTEDGIEKVERALGVENIYDDLSANYVHQFQAAMRAKE